ncbi:MFS transporter [Deinococcus sp. HMF7604]|uniref:MFS transporter n=1 Tax=Deinococcus betulae TaxID=2873312 RepID=UPI001CC8FE3D|nr:MFS transporter [Deinococcus betulae]
MSLPSPAPPSFRPLTWPLLAVGTAAFFTLGVVQAMYGPAFGLFQARYDVPTATVGLIASAHFLGSAAAPLPMGVLLRRVSVRAGTSWSLLVLALGMVGVVLAPAWLLAVAAALVGGLGLGGVSACLNAAYASVGARAVNLVNAVFGVGSMLSPLLVAGLGAGGPGVPFLSVVVLCALALGAGRIWGVPEMAVHTATRLAGRSGVQVGLFAALLVCYVGMEAGYGAWMVRLLRLQSVEAAPLVLSLFWGALTAGRVLMGLWGARLAPAAVVLACAAVLTVCAALSAVPGVATAAFVLAGLALAPVFGTVLAWVSATLSARLVPPLLVAGSLGGALAPALLGTLLAGGGPGAVAAGLGTLAVLMGLFTVLVGRATPAATLPT